MNAARLKMAFNPELRVLIADDHRLISEAVGNLLISEAGFEVETASGLDAVLKTLCESPEFGIVLLDLKMPGMNGLDSVRRVLRAAGNARVILFTGQVDRVFLNHALDAGVAGLIPKTMPLQSLVSVIRLIESGQTFVPMQDGALTDQSNPDQDHDLNDKELFVLKQASEGLTNKEIARDMSTTEVTVKMHMRNICKKLGARNRAHAAIISRERALF